MSDKETPSRKLTALRAFAELIDNMPIEEFTKRLDNIKMCGEPSQYAQLESYLMNCNNKENQDETL